MSETTLAKIAISKAVNEKVDQAVVRVNRDFDGGRVSKTDFMSWILENGIDHLNDVMIAEIRKANFNQTVYLESLVKKLRSAKREKMSVEEIATLQKVLNGTQSKRKPGLRNPTQPKQP